MVSYSNKTYKKKDEEDVRQFLSEKLNKPIGDGPLQPLLSDGILLCDLMQYISPNLQFTRNENKSTFAYHDNIGQFLDCVEKLSIPQAELFQTVDLVEGKSMQSVFSCILAIKRKIAETKTLPLSTKSVSRQTVNNNNESRLHKQQQNLPTLLQQKETKKEYFSKAGLKNNVIGKSAVATAVVDGTFANGHIKNNTLEYISSTKTKRRQDVQLSIVSENIHKYKSNQWQERPKVPVTNNGAVRSKIEMYNQPSPVEIVPRRASTQLYLSKSSETTDGWVKFEEPKATGSFLKVTNGPRLAEKQPPKKESVQNLKKSGSSDMMLSVETVTPKSSKSTPLVTEATENNNGYKINQAACRRASLKQMGTNPVIVKDDNSQETVYALGKSIGKGQFGEVFGGLNMSTGEYVAIKRIRRNDMDCDDMNEVDFLKYLDSEHIVRYKGYSKDREFLNIVLEYVEMGSLRTNIKCFGKFPENLAASHTYKILSGLKYLHDKLVIHCDLKAANILITKTGCLKLTDFGVSLFSKMKDDDTGEPSGTPNWMAPEVIKFNRPTEKSDIWSLGCTVVEMLTGKPPYSNMVSFAVLFKIVEDDTLPIPENISEDARDFLLHCFQKDPKNRSTAAELMQHRWLRHAVISTTGNKPQRPDSLLSTPKKLATKEFKKETISSNTSKKILSDDALLYPKRSYTRENKHKFYSTSVGNSMKVETCYGCLKTINEGEAKCCKECYYLCHSTCALKATKCGKSYNHIHKNESFKPFKNPSYSDPRRLAFERKDTHLKSVYPTKTEPRSYIHKKMNAVFQ